MSVGFSCKMLLRASVCLLCLAQSLGDIHPFVLQSQLDDDVLKSINAFQTNFSDRVLHSNIQSSKLSSLKVMVLNPLYFHYNNITIYASNMRLSPSELVIEDMNLDVLGHKMTPVVHFPWVEINGRLKTGSSAPLPQKCDFSLVLNDLSGSGIVSLSLDLINVTWAQFNFKPKGSIIKIQDPENVLSREILSTLNTTSFGDLLAKRLRRDISFQLSKLVSQQLNQTLKKNSDMSSLAPYSEEISDVAVNNTENANSLIDSILRIGGAIIRSKYGDRIKIPDINEEFSEKYLVTFRGSFRAQDGAAVGTSSVYRVNDIVFGYDNESELHFYGTLGFKALHLVYKRYKAEIWGVGPSGSMETTLAPITTLVHVHLNTTNKILTLEKFKIVNVGDLGVQLTGLGGMLNWLVSLVTTWVMGLFRTRIIHLLENQYEQYGRYIFSQYSLEELLHDGKNEAFVL